MPATRTARRLTPGDVVPPRALTTMTGRTVDLTSPGALTHLQLRRFAGCPICNLHLRSVVGRLEEITAAGVREVVVFHSTAQDLLAYEADLPLDVIPDPDRRLYSELGVEPAVRALLDPRAVLAMLRGTVHDVVAALRGRGKVPPVTPDGGMLGRPADLLLAPDGTVVAVRYGAHAADQWSVDELLDHARRARPALG
ncbi:AhpC/TSA family protein [Actinotalea sp. K2]|uniref:AhpC/TSA family protein n=1 Tax=Actinotalea sp. K2 TaxID=2939438 RepID=UPI002016ACE9|nr:AhpC/TSA family protein [Actinotalea sp. K2]MCL3859495.1 hypothetical protein [Actinotalea sp. K2]